MGQRQCNGVGNGGWRNGGWQYNGGWGNGWHNGGWGNGGWGNGGLTGGLLSPLFGSPGGATAEKLVTRFSPVETGEVLDYAVLLRM